ncbi:dolichol monophosphate mannose synthase [Escherichia coli]|nr:dolichol monophosphate mannose synthase [Escherichia coli]
MRKNELQRKILSYVRNSESPCRTIEIAECLDISIYQSYYYLQKLVNNGKLRRPPLCKGKNVVWKKR